MKWAVIFIFLLACRIALAAMDQPLKDLADVGATDAENAVRVKTAKVLLADYDLIRRDFPQVAQMGNDQIDQWLLDHFAYISQTQTQQTTVNSAISTLASDFKEVYRPEGYGRAWVAKVPGGGLVDAKGVGAVLAQQGDHSNGLATTGESLREFLFEKMTSKALKAGGEKTSTIGSYAVLDFGFDVIHRDGSHSPAGAILRQVDIRNEAMVSDLLPEHSAQIEATLRRFGISTAGDKRFPYGEMINLQEGKSGNLIDFGAYVVPERFEKPALIYDQFINGKWQNLNIPQDEFLKIMALLDPETTPFPQPEASIRVPWDKWGSDVPVDPKYDRMWKRMHEIADAYRHGHMQIEQIRNELGGYLHQLDEIFAHATNPPVKPRWPSFVKRLADAVAAKKIDENKAAKFLYELENRNFILPKDDLSLLSVANHSKEPFRSAAIDIGKKIFPKAFQNFLVSPKQYFEVIASFLNSGSTNLEDMGAEKLSSFMNKNPKYVFSAFEVKGIARWISTERFSRPWVAALSSKILLNESLHNALLAELNDPATIRIAMPQWEKSENEEVFFRFIHDLNPKANEENLIRIAISKFSVPDLEKIAVNTVLNAGPLPPHLTAEIKAAAKNLSLAEQERIFALVERMESVPKALPAPESNSIDCGPAFTKLEK